MSNLRLWYKKDEEVLSARTGDLTINLPTSGWLSALIIRLIVANAATDSRFLHPHDGLTKIELLADGGEELKVLDGRLCKGLNHLDGITFSGDYIIQANDMNQWETFYLLFGEKLGDEVYGLDLSKHTGPQLKITWDGSLTSIENTAATVAWHATTFPKLSVICAFLEGAPGSPRGFVRSKYTTYTPAASAEKPITIPRGEPLRRIFLRNFYAGSDPYDVFNRVKLEVNEAKYVPYNIRYLDLLALNAQLYGQAEYSARLRYTSQEREDAHVSDYLSLAPVIRSDQAAMFYIQSLGGGQLRLRVERVSGTNYASATNLNYMVRGPCLHHVMALPLDVPGGLAAAMPTRDKSAVELKITSNAYAQTSSKAYVGWETVVPY